MKLLMCTECGDFVRLFIYKRECQCGAVAGRYIDERRAVISGPCCLIGFQTASFRNAQLVTDALVGVTNLGGIQFSAFVILEPCPTFKRVETVTDG